MGKPPPSISPEVLQRYLLNTCTEQEREAVEEWYATLQGTPDYLDTLSEKEQNLLQAETFQQIQEQLTPDQDRTERHSTLRTLHPGWWLGIAASLLAIVGIWLVLPQLSSSGPTATKNLPEQIAPPVASLIKFVNDKPRMVMHQLPDSSTVWMHAESSITYPQAFEANRRMVTFEGEGFFDIKPDKKRPFTIQSGAMKVEVLGTSFNVKAPAKQSIYEVSVVSGSVAVSAPTSEASDQKVVLAPKQQALFEIQNRRLTSNTIPAEIKKEIYEPITITFEGAPLDQVVQQLSKRFDVRVHLINPAMKSCRLTADFEEQSLPAILEMLCTSLDATYTMSGKTILIEGASCE